MKRKKAIWLSLLMVIVLSFLLPQSVQNPVDGTTNTSYNHQTFWHPWGDHHHHGIDIFAKKGTPIRSAVNLGIVIAITKENMFGKANLGGNTVTVLGSHGRLYYYAHMDEIETFVGAIVTSNSVLGTVGNSGNASKTPSHCHFSILTVFPILDHWVPREKRTKSDDAFKIFFVNPVLALEGKQLW